MQSKTRNYDKDNEDDTKEKGSVCLMTDAHLCIDFLIFHCDFVYFYRFVFIVWCLFAWKLWKFLMCFDACFAIFIC